MNKALKIKFEQKLTQSKLVRTLLYPEMVLYRDWLQKKYEKSDDPQYIRGLKGKYAGKRCFIIGNGPSLTPEDLDRIRDEYSFGSNRIYHIFDKTQWRPTWYVSIDNNVINPEIDNIKQSGDYPKLLNFKARQFGRQKEDNIHYFFFNQERFYIDPWKGEQSVSSLNEDPSRYFSRVATVTVSAIELAIYMGFKRIYLLGVDNSYARTMGADGKITVDPTIKSDYFAGMKGETDASGRSTSLLNIKETDHAYELAKEFSEKHGVKIYNATRGGKLETFERVDFDELMERKKEKSDE